MRWGKSTVTRAETGRCLAAVLCAGLGLAPPAATADTRANTPISNVAAASWQVGGSTGTVTSNTDRFSTTERLDIALATAGAPAPSGGDTAWPVQLTNRGNGEESFVLSAMAGDAAARVAIDSDGDGRFDPARDQVIDGKTASLAPGASQLIFVLLPSASTATPVLDARAATGSGAPGLTFPGAGDGGVDAVVGQTGASARLTLGGGDAGAPVGSLPALIKSQSVLAPDGSDRPVTGAVITYTLEAHFAGPIAGARIEDAVPAGTRLVPGSMRLDDAPLTDAADGDAGTADTTGIAVTLGDVPAAAIHRVRFQVQLP